jgi:Predicted sugar phosphatases of the HAD superfamily
MNIIRNVQGYLKEKYGAIANIKNEEKYREIYAVDFDGTLHLGKWPEIGAPNIELIEFLKKTQAAGDKVILWTCRAGERLGAAVAWCSEQGLEFDAINQNLQENIDYWGNDSRKVYAHYYIDDRNLNIEQIVKGDGRENGLQGRER